MITSPGRSTASSRAPSGRLASGVEPRGAAGFRSVRAARPGFEPLDRLEDLHGIRRDRDERQVDAAFDHLFERRQRDGIPSRHPGGVNGALHAIWASRKPHQRLH
jgi:hypothetical protein